MLYESSRIVSHRIVFDDYVTNDFDRSILMCCMNRVGSYRIISYCIESMMVYIVLMVSIVLMMVTCLMSEPFRTAGVFLSFVVDPVDVQIVWHCSKTKLVICF